RLGATGFGVKRVMASVSPGRTVCSIREPPRRRTGSLVLQRGLAPKSLSAFLLGLPCGPVANLVIRNGLSQVLPPTRAPSPPQHLQAAHVQRPAHLLHGHFRVFPPASVPCAAPRTPVPSGTGSGAASARHSHAPRSASARFPTC